MSGIDNALRAAKTAAKRIGVPLAEYQQRLAEGLKYCWPCRTWHSRTDFATDASRGDGLKASCRAANSLRARAAYKPRPSPGRRGFIAPTRDGDKKQARRRVNYLVESGQLRAPGTLACTDCGHLGDDRRHEYDHARGYDGQNQLYVEPVCTTCHHEREARRGC